MTTSPKKNCDTLSVLIVGCGNIAGGWDVGRDDALVRTHAKAYASHGGFHLAACIDPDSERRLAFQQHWHVGHTYADLDEVADLAFDVVSLCSPAEMHAPALERLLAMDVGVVFCEKPLTANISSARRLVGLYGDAGRPLVVNYLRRWDPAVQALKAEIAAGSWGAVLGGRGVYTKGIFNNGSHLVDLLHFLIGPMRPLAVHRVVGDWTADDPTLDAVLATPDGAPFHLVAGDRRAYTVWELELLFERGRVAFTESGFVLRTDRVVDDARFDGYRVLQMGEPRPTGLGDALQHAVASLAGCLNGTTVPPSTGETALAAHEVCARLARMAAE